MDFHVYYIIFILSVNNRRARLSTVYTTAVPHPESESGKQEQGTLISALLAAWPDIIVALETKAEGFKKHKLEEAAQHAFERAVRTMEAAFGTPQYFQEALDQHFFAIPETMDRGHVMHFMGRWKSQAEAAQRIAAGTMHRKKDLTDVMVMRGTRDSRAITPQEAARRRENKKQKKGGGN